MNKKEYNKIEELKDKFQNRIYIANNTKNHYTDQSTKNYFDGRIDSYREIVYYLGESLK